MQFLRTPWVVNIKQQSLAKNQHGHSQWMIQQEKGFHKLEMLGHQISTIQITTGVDHQGFLEKFQ
jgi:hypothetical protein